MLSTTDIAKLSESEFDAYIRQVAAEEHARGLDNLPRADRSGWCQCKSTEGEESYYSTPDHRHGWFHDTLFGGCGRITQTG